MRAMKSVKSMTMPAVRKKPAKRAMKSMNCLLYTSPSQRD